MNTPLDLFEGLNSPPQILPPQKKTEWRRIYVNFLQHSDVESFARRVNRSISAKTKELWWPENWNSTIGTLFEVDDSAAYEQPQRRRKQEWDDLNTDLFDYEYEPGFYELHWVGMPRFNQPDSGAVRKITCWFMTGDDVKAFAKTINQNISDKAPSIWYPYREKNNVADLYWISTT